MKLAKERISFSLLAGGFDVPDLKPLTTSWLHSRRLAAPKTKDEGRKHTKKKKDY
jgi:hypothetical protein